MRVRLSFAEGRTMGSRQQEWAPGGSVDRGSGSDDDSDGPLCCPFKFKLPVRPPAPLASGVAAAAQAATCKSGSRSPGHQRRPGCVTLGPGPPCQSHSHGQLRTFKLRLLVVTLWCGHCQWQVGRPGRRPGGRR